MYPILFQIGSIKIGSYGVLLATAFLSGFLLVNRQFEKNGCDVNLAWDLHFLAIFGGLVGSRVMFIIENFKDFTDDPMSMIFSTTGFSVLGGYVMAFALCAWRVCKAGEDFFKLADLYTPGLAIGYCIGRLGCIAAGDGCYGIPCELPWAMSFPNGIVSTLSSSNHSLAELYTKMNPGKSLPVDITVHPTPLYESLSVFVLLMILLLRKWNIGSGARFGLFLTWFGISRFLVEFIRLNPFDYFGMSSSQLVSIFFIISGVIILVTSKLRKRQSK